MKTEKLLTCPNIQIDFIKTEFELSKKNEIYVWVFNNLIGNEYRYPNYNGNSMGFLDMMNYIHQEDESLFDYIFDLLIFMYDETIDLEYYEASHNIRLILFDMKEIRSLYISTELSST